jgi:hypothetical protein
MPPSLPPKAIFRQDQDKLWWSKKASDFARHSPTLRDEVGEHPANWRVGSFACPKPCCFLCLKTKKVTKENSRLQIILGLLFFSLPAQYNSSSFVLLKQYCLQQALTASFKTVAIPKIL